MLMGGTLFVPTIPRRETYEFTDLDIEPVADLLGKVDRFGRAGRAVDLAVRRFEGSYARGPEEDQMIDAWVALEALSAPETSTELRYRASNRIARLIGPDTAARVELQSFLRLSYDVRSHLVHGGDPEKFRREVQKKVDGLGGLDAVVSETTDVLRRVLRAWLDDPRSPETVVQDLDAQMMA
jgi:hypothetical protein